MVMARLLALAIIWAALTAATPLPLTPPLPDLAPLVPFAEAPIDKPALRFDVALPPEPVEMPPLPPATVRLPAADKPMAFLQPPRTLPCVGAWLGIAKESLECGRARFQRGELEEAVKALESATRGTTEREVLTEARYWLAEAYYRIGRLEQADWLFRQVAQDSPRGDWGVWALSSSGWTALRLGDAARAREAFAAVLNGPLPANLDAWARHGLGLALYALGRYPDAEQAWARLADRTPSALARDVTFWHGETLGRVAQYTRAEELLRRFTGGGPHPMLDTGVLHLAWWTLATGRARDSVAVFRQALARPAAAGLRDWAEAGLALALMTAQEWDEARVAVQALATRRSPLALPMQLKLLRAALGAPKADAETLTQELLGAPITPATRAWVLLTRGEVERARGDRDEARTQFDLAQKVEPNTLTAWQATFRLARVNFELREFAQALADVTPLASARVPPELRAPALLLQGEAAYAVGDYVTAAAAFRRVLAEFASSADGPSARLALAWSLLRERRSADARREFLEFARTAPEHPGADEALLLASELALAAGDLEAARTLVERVIASYPTQPQTDFARLNRGLLLMRTGHAPEAQAAITDWLGRAPFPALFGRAHAALGVVALQMGNPQEAAAEFAMARRDGVGALASLGLGTTALADNRVDDATKLLTEARDGGVPDVAAAARYGLTIAAYQRGATRDFKKPALAALDAARRQPARAARLLYVLTGIAVEEKDWPEALVYARRLVAEHAQADVTDDALERVGAGAAAAPAWPVVYEAYSLLRQRFPKSPFVDEARLRLAEAMLETRRLDAARRELEDFVAISPGDPRVPQALLLLARAREQAGDRPGALEAYSRAAREGQGPEWTKDALFGHARLLAQERRWDQARAVLDRLLKQSDRATSVDAARAIADAYAAEGDGLAAAEYYLSAAYLAPETPAGRRALLDAGKTFAALKQEESAVIVYRKLLAQSDLPPDLAMAARQGLTALGQRP